MSPLGGGLKSLHALPAIIIMPSWQSALFAPHTQTHMLFTHTYPHKLLHSHAFLPSSAKDTACHHHATPYQVSGDVVSDVPINALLASHQMQGALATVTLVPCKTSPSADTKPGKAPKARESVRVCPMDVGNT